MCVYLKSKDPSLNSRTAPKPRVNDGLKMRASVRMTRYLESWGAVKPFAHLQSREGFTPDTIVNGKPRFKVGRLCTSYLFGSVLVVIKVTFIRQDNNYLVRGQFMSQTKRFDELCLGGWCISV